MELNTIIESIITQGPYAALFIWLLIDTNKKTEARELKSEEREKRMQEQLDKTVPVLNQIVERLDVIEDKIKH